jgi:4-amino-4-deoxy-L-arabinose transferase-like glycosyltransferase
MAPVVAGGPARAFPAVVTAGLVAVCAHGVWRASLWKAAEPRVMDIARDQYAHGFPRSLTFSGMPFLEEPPLYFDLTATAFHVGGGPSVLAARAVVALLSLARVAAVVLVVRRAAGARAGLLAGALLVASQSFAMLVRRLGVDIALVSALSVSMALLHRATETDDERVDGRWWWASLAAADVAALAKGPFGTFLFVMPTFAYAVLFGDRRVLRALFRPASIALLLLPHVAWGAVLLDAGGWTFVFEHFVNNTLGRVLHHRFQVAGTSDLPYGDVGPAYAWYHSLRSVAQGALPGALAVPFAVAAQRAQGGLRATDARSRLFALALCWGCVPPILLTFSVYKGRDHLGASSAALIVAGALWLSRKLPSEEESPPPRWGLAGVVALYALAPLLVIGAFLGLPATRSDANALMAGIGSVAVVGIVAALLSRRWTLALWFLLAGLGTAMVAGFTPGATLDDDRGNSLDPVARWIAREAGDAPVGLYVPRTRAPTDEIGEAEEPAVASLAYWLGRPAVQLVSPADVRSYLRRTEPAFFVVCRSRDDPPQTWPDGEPAVGWHATGGNESTEITLVANRAAAAGSAAPSVPPPDTARPP